MVIYHSKSKMQKNKTQKNTSKFIIKNKPLLGGSSKWPKWPIKGGSLTTYKSSNDLPSVFLHFFCSKKKRSNICRIPPIFFCSNFNGFFPVCFPRSPDGTGQGVGA